MNHLQIGRREEEERNCSERRKQQKPTMLSLRAGQYVLELLYMYPLFFDFITGMHRGIMN